MFLCSFAIGIVGDAGVRGTAQQPRLYVGMILILIFAEVLGKSCRFPFQIDPSQINNLFSHRSLRIDCRSSYELPLESHLLNEQRLVAPRKPDLLLSYLFKVSLADRGFWRVSLDLRPRHNNSRISSHYVGKRGKRCKEKMICGNDIFTLTRFSFSGGM
jgi:hypothetical protein